MMTLQFADTYNLVGFLSKPTKSEGFEQIVDFLNANPIRYALTINPTIHTSCIKQLWATAKVKTVNGEVQLQALVDGKKIIVTKASFRCDLQLNDGEGTDSLPNATIFEELTRIGTMASAIICLATNQKLNFSKYIFKDEAINEEMYDSSERAATTATSLDVEQDRGNINKTQSKATLNEPSSLGTSLSSGPKRQDTMRDTIARTRFENVSKTSNDSLLAGEDESKQQSKINDIDKDVEFTLLDETQGRYGDEDMFGVNDLEALKSAKPKADKVMLQEPELGTITTTTAAITVTTTSIRPKAKGLVIHEEEQATTPKVSSQQPSQDKAHDKGKGIMVEEPVKMKKKDQISLDEELC
ncbi:hypothetical protein Tco_1135012 [Tanacetum coccineum]